MNLELDAQPSMSKHAKTEMQKDCFLLYDLPYSASYEVVGFKDKIRS